MCHHFRVPEKVYLSFRMCLSFGMPEVVGCRGAEEGGVPEKVAFDGRAWGVWDMEVCGGELGLCAHVPCCMGYSNAPQVKRCGGLPMGNW